MHFKVSAHLLLTTNHSVRALYRDNRSVLITMTTLFVLEQLITIMATAFTFIFGGPDERTCTIVAGLVLSIPYW